MGETPPAGQTRKRAASIEYFLTSLPMTRRSWPASAAARVMLPFDFSRMFDRYSRSNFSRARIFAAVYGITGCPCAHSSGVCGHGPDCEFCGMGSFNGPS